MLQQSIDKIDFRRTVRRFGIALAVLLLLVAWGSAQAQESATEGWTPVPSITSGGLAQTGCQLLGTTGLSWADGRQGIVTFWHCQNGNTLRCLDYFSAEMSTTGGRCDSVSAQK
jgi:hypothetical protein